MFDELGPRSAPLPPADALDRAVRRGRGLRRQRRAAVASGALACVVLLGGIAVAGGWGQGPDRAEPVPVGTPSVVPDRSPIPQGWSSERGGLDYGRLLGVTVVDGVVTLQVDREAIYFGAAAEERNREEAAVTGYVEEDTDGERTLTFPLDPQASIEAENLLRTDYPGDGTVDRQPLTPAQLVGVAGREEVRQGFVRVWLRHAGGPDGPVTALAEQHLP